MQGPGQWAGARTFVHETRNSRDTRSEMEQLGWLLALLLVALSVWLWRRGRSVAPSPAVDTGRAFSEDEVRNEALQAAADYLTRTVAVDLETLRAGLPADSPLQEALDQALQAVEDLTFYAAPPPEEVWTDEDLAQVVQEAVREYTRQTLVPVRVHPPADPVRVRVRREALKDAVFMLLTNAGLYSGGRPVDVHLEQKPPQGFTIHIRDSGPGFTPEALMRATEPFWSTDARGLGLGLPYVRRRVALLKGSLSLRNQPDGGAEVSVSFPEGTVGPSTQ